MRDNLFDLTVMAIVTEKPDMKQIQGVLAWEQFRFKFGEEIVIERAKLLCERIKKQKRILFFLDDLSSGIDLDRVGIPFGIDHTGFKIVLFSGCPEVFFNQMNTAMNYFT
ncbi:uncharacterized protein LOC114411361 [Glycine soja]|uniref:uncharacterized protein LOC114411361 n=1 Tax=Glycine soja TaxID=3848 RepID=UPI0010401684|nr:uncharacterized protein LOC114411361 [Glycine soja]